MRVLVTGATGFVGRRVVPALVDRGHDVAALVREPTAQRVAPLRRATGVEVVEGDLLEPTSLPDALRGADAGYYLVHSLGSGPGYERRDRLAARAFGRAAARTGLDTVVYLGALGPEGFGDGPPAGRDGGRREQVGPVDGGSSSARDTARDDRHDAEGGAGHLASRRAVETDLGGRDYRLVALRAAVVVGAGSASYQLFSRLVRRLPVVPAPPAIRTHCQPIAVRDAVACLVAALQLPGQADRTLEIGGPDRFSYADLLRRTAAAIDARVHVRSVPGVPLWVAARGLSAVAGLPIETVRPLVESLPTPAVVTDDAARQAFPFDRTPFAEAVSRAATVDSGTDRDTGGPAGRSAPMSDLPRPPLPEVFE